MNKGQLKKHINWYCWNGTNFQCDFNKLPLKGIDVRNTGLVFQSDTFGSIIREKIRNIFANNEDIIIINNNTDILSAYCDNNDITNNIKNILKNKKTDYKININNTDLIDNNIEINYNNITISYLYDG
jgi:predicted metallo-beta-lactamase superfamily hydrolase